MRRLILTPFAMMALLMAAPVCGGQVPATAPTAEQSERLDSALTANAVELATHEGRLSAAGVERLAAAIGAVQFVTVGEQHGYQQMPEIAAALFEHLHRTQGFRYIAVENGGIAMDQLQTGARRGQADSLRAFVRRYPYALAFNSDPFLQMFTTVGRMQPAAEVWGFDQEFGATHALEVLRARLPAGRERTVVDSLHALARAGEAVRTPDTRLYMASEKPELFHTTLTRLSEHGDGAIADAARNLLISDRIYEYNRRARTDATGFQSNDTREEYMKRQFMAKYRSAAASGSPPKVLLYGGLGHMYTGASPFGPLSLGNFIREFATANGTRAFNLALLPNNPAGAEVGDLRRWAAMAPLAESAAPDRLTLIDLRALRNYAYNGRFGPLPADLRRMIMHYDAVLLIGGIEEARRTIAQ